MAWFWLVAGGAAVVADCQAGYVDGLEVRQGEAAEAGKIGIVPAGIGRADEAAAVAVIGEDDAVVAHGGDDDGCLRG